MKKLISIALLLAVFILVFSACSLADDAKSGYLPMTAYIECGGAEGSNSSIDPSRQYVSIRNEDISEPTNTTLAVTILGTQYNANYVGKEAMSFGCPKYTYKTTDGDEISIDNTGKLLFFTTAQSFSYRVMDSRDEAAKAILKSPEEYLAIATQYAREIFGDDITSRYAGSLPEISSTRIWVRFSAASNYRSDYRILDKFTIVITAEGEFQTLYSHNMSDLSNRAIPADLTNDDLTQIISNSLVNKDVQIQLGSIRTLIILPDGRFACYTSFKTSDSKSDEAWATVVIPLE